ncbi:MAG: zinc ribbon domain-containing protein [Deltaproteobacteria bacterium]|nr:zinc ribbon domain-containing protein [Deltaproteobacteria bacterium]
MPVYEYGCEKCGEVFEVKQKFSDDPITECKFCKGPVHKLISAPAFSLKGSGWSKTNYAKSPSWHDVGAKKYDKSLSKHCSFRAKGMEPPDCCKPKQ